jgi:hypothetical protein
MKLKFFKCLMFINAFTLHVNTLKPKYPILIGLITIAASAFGQTASDTSRKIFLRDGIYLENLKLVLPWNFQLKDTAIYGHPKVQ